MNLDVLAIGAHPDDVELACGGTLARLSNEGRRVGILHLTRGERGTRGTPEQRRAEAERAAASLGAAELAFLDCGDGALRTGEAEEEALIKVLRAWRPEVVLGPPPRDRHPDHGRAHQLVASAAFYSGLAARGHGSPHRPAAVFSFMQHDQFAPSFLVDVSSSWERKLEALSAYRSQLAVPDPTAVANPGPTATVTKISTREFWLAVEGRARHYGELIGAPLAEPFWSRLPLAVSDLLSILPGGVR